MDILRTVSFLFLFSLTALSQTSEKDIPETHTTWLIVPNRPRTFAIPISLKCPKTNVAKILKIRTTFRVKSQIIIHRRIFFNTKTYRTFKTLALSIDHSTTFTPSDRWRLDKNDGDPRVSLGTPFANPATALGTPPYLCTGPVSGNSNLVTTDRPIW